MQEFSLIDWIRDQVGPGGSDVVLGIGDDAAVLDVPDGERLVVTSDTLGSGTHFNSDDPPETVGHKSLAVNLSDLAAMGAMPRWALLSLCLPAGMDAWTRAFIHGFLALARSCNVRLVGGDISSGSLCVGVTAMGSTREGRFLRRDGARPGDLVVVSGTLGDAAYALSELEDGRLPDSAVLERLRLPLPRVGLGAALVGNATACIDVSDGLLADLGHIAQASALGAVVYVQQLPASKALLDRPEDQRYALQLTGGDDYELCFTWPGGKRESLRGLSGDQGLDLTVVGTMQVGDEVRCVDPNGRELAFKTRGYTHQL